MRHRTQRNPLTGEFAHALVTPSLFDDDPARRARRDRSARIEANVRALFPGGVLPIERREVRTVGGT